jgi:chitinase
MRHASVISVLVLLLVLSTSSSFPALPARKLFTFKSAPLPEKLLVGYANWNQCDDSIVRAVEDGVNVIIWFSINLADGPAITNGPDMDCVANISKTLRDKKLDVVHLISIGGWNSPHPSTRHSAEETFNHWHDWNTKVAARPASGFLGFDGIDWDIEGNDDLGSKLNVFSPATLDLMGEFSRMAKRAGYVVAMAPAESYLDPSTSAFSLRLTHNYEEWMDLQPGFTYHGRNIYGYLIAKYGDTMLYDGSSSTIIPTFDFVTVQLYEGYSHAMFAMGLQGVPATEYLPKLVDRLEEGWKINFSEEPDINLENQKVSIPSSRLVLGLANGWAGDGKFLFLSAQQVDAAHKAMHGKVRGYAFWNILDEGRRLSRPTTVTEIGTCAELGKGSCRSCTDIEAEETTDIVWLARGLNSFLKIRKQN